MQQVDPEAFAPDRLEGGKASPVAERGQPARARPHPEIGPREKEKGPGEDGEVVGGFKPGLGKPEGEEPGAGGVPAFGQLRGEGRKAEDAVRHPPAEKEEGEKEEEPGGGGDPVEQGAQQREEDHARAEQVEDAKAVGHHREQAGDESDEQSAGETGEPAPQVAAGVTGDGARNEDEEPGEEGLQELLEQRRVEDGGS